MKRDDQGGYLTDQLFVQRKTSPPAAAGLVTILTLTLMVLLPYVVTLTLPVLRLFVYEQYWTSPRVAARLLVDLHDTVMDLSEPADDGVIFADFTTVVVPVRGRVFFVVVLTTSCAPSEADAVYVNSIEPLALGDRPEEA
ncbi:MAG TPA: hypothetical protein DCQ04_01980 [Actinobacteria bacterium]|nr:hypothetical protein [Actinomycetota bacterium]